MRGESARIGVDERVRGRRCHRRVSGAGAHQRALRKLVQLLDTQCAAWHDRRAVVRRRTLAATTRVALRLAGARITRPRDGARAPRRPFPAIMQRDANVGFAGDAGDVRRQQQDEDIPPAAILQPAARARTHRARHRRACPTLSAAASAASFTISPREVLISTASAFISASLSASISSRVAGVSGTWIETTSASRSTSSNLRGGVRSADHIGMLGGNHRVEADDLHAERARESAPVELADLAEADRRPASCPPARARWTARTRPLCPPRPHRVLAYAPRSSINAAAITYSATASALAPVAGMTSMPRDLQAEDVDVVEPDAQPADDFNSAPRRGARRSTCVLLRTINASASVSWRLSLSRCSPRSASEATSRIGPQRRDRCRLHELADDDRAIARSPVTQLCMPHLRTVRVFDGAENDVLDQEADHDHGEQAGEHVRDLELILVLVDEPAQAARAGRHAEHQLGRDQGAPGKRPADLESGQDARNAAGMRMRADIRQAAQAVVATDHAHGVGHRKESGMRVQRDRPQHRMDQHEHQAAGAEPEPDQRQRQQARSQAAD